MIVVDPMPNELAASHAERISFINCCIDKKDFDQRVAKKLVGKGLEPKSMPRLNQLALVSEMSCTDYARLHSMLPSLRVAARTGEDQLHGDPEGATFTRRLGLLTQRSGCGGAYICRECVKADLLDRHLSWFRRTHHLVGVDWCQFHRTKLTRVTASNPWAHSPHHWVESEELEELSTCFDELEDRGFLGRYVDISTMLIERGQPFDVRSIGQALAKRAQAQGLRIGLNGVKPLLSDLVKSMAPTEWVKAHFPELQNNPKTTFFPAVDSLVVSRTVPGTGHAYAIALAALFDTSEEALRYCQCETGRSNLPTQKRAHLRRGNDFWNGEFFAVYLECNGRTQKIAERLQMDRTYLQEKMKNLGIPSQHEVLHDPKWRALVRFNRGESLQFACAREGVDCTKVEPHLRLSEARVINLAVTITAKLRSDGCQVTDCCNKPKASERAQIPEEQDASEALA